MPQSGRSRSANSCRRSGPGGRCRAARPATRRDLLQQQVAAGWPCVSLGLGDPDRGSRSTRATRCAPSGPARAEARPPTPAGWAARSACPWTPGARARPTGADLVDQPQHHRDRRPPPSRSTRSPSARRRHRPAALRAGSAATASAPRSPPPGDRDRVQTTAPAGSAPARSPLSAPSWLWRSRTTTTNQSSGGITSTCRGRRVCPRARTTLAAGCHARQHERRGQPSRPHRLVAQRHDRRTPRPSQRNGAARRSSSSRAKGRLSSCLIRSASPPPGPQD